MAKLFSLEYGIGGICVLLTLMVLIRVGEFVWKLQQKKEQLSEKTVGDLTRAVQENTVETKTLGQRIVHLEGALGEVTKLKTDVRRFYSAIKELAGDRWPAIRDEITKDGFTI